MEGSDEADQLLQSQMIPSEDEDQYEEDEVPRPLKRQNAGKGLLSLQSSVRCQEKYEEEEDQAVLGQPDLGDYFGRWEMPPSSEIALCRTYANYLASKLKASTTK